MHAFILFYSCLSSIPKQKTKSKRILKRLNNSISFGKKKREKHMPSKKKKKVKVQGAAAYRRGNLHGFGLKMPH